jgi:hypothetical protein
VVVVEGVSADDARAILGVMVTCSPGDIASAKYYAVAS